MQPGAWFPPAGSNGSRVRPWLVVGLFAATFFAASCGRAVYTGDELAKLVQGAGAVTVNGKPATLGQSLKADDKIEVGQNAWARVQYYDSSTMLLVWDAKNKVPGTLLLKKHDGVLGQMLVKLTTGIVGFLIPKDRPFKDRYEVETDSLVTTIRGTTGLLASSRDGDDVALAEGTVAVSSRAGGAPVEVGAGQMTSCAPGAMPGSPVAVDWYRFEAVFTTPGAEAIGQSFRELIDSGRRLAITDLIPKPLVDLPVVRETWQKHRWAIVGTLLAALAWAWWTGSSFYLGLLLILGLVVETGFGLSRVWVLIQGFRLPLGALVLGIGACSLSRSASRAGDEARLHIVQRLLRQLVGFITFWAPAMALSNGLTAFDVSEPTRSFLGIGRLLIAVPGWNTTTFPGSGYSSFALEMGTAMAALFLLLALRDLGTSSPATTCRFCKKPRGEKMYYAPDALASSNWSNAVAGRLEDLLNGAATNLGVIVPGVPIRWVVTVLVSWCQRCQVGLVRVQRAEAGRPPESRELEMRGPKTAQLVKKLA